MKNATNIGMLAAVVFAVGMVGINFSDGTITLQNEASTPTSMEGGSLLGHIEVIHTDSEGNILSYLQTDNAIVQDGRNCTAMLLFGDNGECDAPNAGALGKYDVIGLGNGTALSGTTDITDLNGEITDGLGLARTQDVSSKAASYTNATGNDGIGVQRITAQFTWTGGGTNTVNQAGLFNQTTVANDSTFALKNFPTSVAMNTNDQLTVNWDISIDGTSAYS